MKQTSLERAGLTAMGKATVRVPAVPARPGHEWCDHEIRLYVDREGARYVRDEDVRSALGMGERFVFTVPSVYVEWGEGQDWYALAFEPLIKALRYDQHDRETHSEMTRKAIARFITELPRTIAPVVQLRPRTS